jgi:DNA polymerase III delta subunit
MMLILHGSNLPASRQALTSQKETAKTKGSEIIELIGKSLDLTSLKQALESTSLFGQDRLVTIEGLFSLPKSKNKETLLDYLKKEKFTAELVIWEQAQIDGRALRFFGSKAQIRLFKLPALIFKFLDSLSPRNSKESLRLFQELKKSEPAELVFYLLARRTKDLLIAKDLGKKGLEGAPWQQGRLLHQAAPFSLEELLRLHRRLLKLDWEQKTGRAVMGLSESLDLLLLNL